MRTTSSGRYIAPLAILLSLPGVLEGQLISLKTVPVAAGDQFLIFPSEHLAMGGVGIALDDPLADPFVNPAMAGRVVEPQVFAAPTFYSISNNAGSARTLPAGALVTARGWFGGAYVAMQQLDKGDQWFWPGPMWEDVLPPDALSRRSAVNKYAHGSFGRTFASSLSIGASVFLADLRAMDGVEHLYSTASDIAQSGHMEDLRLGLSKQFPGDRRLEAVVLHHWFKMTHDVTYMEWVLVDSVPGDSIPGNWQQQTRLETNVDRSRTWGAHVGYHQPIGSRGWRIGGAFTMNRKSHPKIPNYEIMNIPRDPGHSSAFDIGFGLAKVTGRTTFGLDLVYEPASSETWAVADGPVATASGDTIPSGGKTIENSFDFSNAFISMGVAHHVGPATFQAGLQVRSYGFHLDQWDNVAETSRRQDEDWMEWVPSWGATVRLADIDLRYMGRVTTGTGRPGVAWTGGAAERLSDMAAANDILLPPSGPLTLQDALVMTHQFSVSIPIR